MRVRFWGVRGSLPSPLRPSQVRGKVKRVLQGAAGVDLEDGGAVDAYLDSLWPLGSGTAGGNTSCVEVEAGGRRIVLDAGSGLRELGRKLMEEDFGRGRGRLDMLISHTHWDHIMGLPFFTPAYVPGNTIDIHSPFPDLEDRLRDQHRPVHFPVPWEVLAKTVTCHRWEANSTLALGEVEVRAIPLRHPGSCFGYRIEHDGKAMVYATDSEYKDNADDETRRIWSEFRGAEVLISDAQYTLSEALEKEDWGHSSAVVGVEAAVAAGVRRLVLFHHEPTHGDEMIAQILEKAKRYLRLVGPAAECEILGAHEEMELLL